MMSSSAVKDPAEMNQMMRSRVYLHENFMTVMIRSWMIPKTNDGVKWTRDGSSSEQQITLSDQISRCEESQDQALDNLQAALNNLMVSTIMSRQACALLRMMIIATSNKSAPCYPQTSSSQTEICVCVCVFAAFAVCRGPKIAEGETFEDQAAQEVNDAFGALVRNACHSQAIPDANLLPLSPSH